MWSYRTGGSKLHAFINVTENEKKNRHSLKNEEYISFYNFY